MSIVSPILVSVLLHSEKHDLNCEFIRANDERFNKGK